MSPKPGRLQRSYQRSGPDYRFGDDVSFTDIKNEFGFVTVKVGRWVTKHEQQLAANLFYDAFADLAFLLNVPSAVIGLRHTLNLAFGTGGREHVQAHYSPSQRTLALAKNAGGGALAHEWWHAFDHYICQKIYPLSSKSFASEQWLIQKTPATHPLNQALEMFFSESILTSDGLNPNQFSQNAFALDKAQGHVYYSEPTELMARAFESILQAQSTIENKFLVSGTFAKGEPLIYPSREHRKLISKCCFAYFNLLGDTLRARL